MITLYTFWRWKDKILVFQEMKAEIHMKILSVPYILCGDSLELHLEN